MRWLVKCRSLSNLLYTTASVLLDIEIQLHTSVDVHSMIAIVGKNDMVVIPGSGVAPSDYNVEQLINRFAH